MYARDACSDSWQCVAVPIDLGDPHGLVCKTEKLTLNRQPRHGIVGCLFAARVCGMNPLFLMIGRPATLLVVCLPGTKRQLASADPFALTVRARQQTEDRKGFHYVTDCVALKALAKDGSPTPNNKKPPEGGFL